MDVYLCRHGHSVANNENIIISKLEDGIDPKWGLTDLGRQQADAAGECLLKSLGKFDPGRFRVFTSPFSRTMETALQAASHLEVGFKDPRLTKAEELRERYFGSYDHKSTSYYAEVWAEDSKDPGAKPPGNGESTTDVANRLREFIQSLEAQFQDYNILLVSHGDALSILAAMLLGDNLTNHRKHGLGNCGILRFPQV